MAIYPLMVVLIPDLYKRLASTWLYIYITITCVGNVNGGYSTWCGFGFYESVLSDNMCVLQSNKIVNCAYKNFFLRIRELSHQKVPNHIRKVNYLLPLFSLEKDQDFKLIDHESRKRNCQKTMYEDKLGRLFQSTHIPKTKGKRPT